ncbi:hypothetical protein ACFP1Z_00220 [Streptomyces gamaensis]|uniref:Uncharacterized protein n=1 Tax=Streptomyces gamaensis TaxID=1763542 RepID=A0ABW0YRX7_9ACTN
MSLSGHGSTAGSSPVAAARLLNTLVTQGSFVAALMYYLGAIWSMAYYGYFHVDAFALGLGFAEFVIHSLGLITTPVVVTGALAVLLFGSRGTLTRRAALLPPRAAAQVTRAANALARLHGWLVIAGIVMVLAWRDVQPYGWLAPVAIAAGILLGRRRTPTSPGTAAPGRAVPLLAAGLFLLWAATLHAHDLGVADARHTAGALVHRTAVVVFSVDRLSLTGPPAVTVQDLGDDVRFRYRYTGLRLLIERDGHYYVLPLGWRAAESSTYVLRENDRMRVELMPGTWRP